MEVVPWFWRRSRAVLGGIKSPSSRSLAQKGSPSLGSTLRRQQRFPIAVLGGHRRSLASSPPQASSLDLEAETREGVQPPPGSHELVNPPEATKLHEPLPTNLYTPQESEHSAYGESERRGASGRQGKTALMACTKTLQLVSVLP